MEINELNSLRIRNNYTNRDTYINKDQIICIEQSVDDPNEWSIITSKFRFDISGMEPDIMSSDSYIAKDINIYKI